MTCEQSRAWMLASGLHEADLAAAASAWEHAQHCPACRAALADVERFHGALSSEDDAAEPDRGWLEFEERLLKGATEAESRRSGTPRLRLWRWPLALAASAALATGGWLLHDSLRGGPVTPVLPPQPPTARGLALSNNDVRENLLVFKRVNEVLEGKMGWIALAGPTSDVGVDAASARQIHRLLVVRVALVRNGAFAAQTDLVVVPGQNPEVTVPLDDKTRVRYSVGTSRADPQMLALSAQIEPVDSTQDLLASVTTRLQTQDGRTYSAGRLVTDDASYDLKVSLMQTEQPG